jgi:hypothetical protein
VGELGDPISIGTIPAASRRVAGGASGPTFRVDRGAPSPTVVGHRRRLGRPSLVLQATKSPATGRAKSRKKFVIESLIFKHPRISVSPGFRPVRLRSRGWSQPRQSFHGHSHPIGGVLSFAVFGLICRRRVASKSSRTRSRQAVCMRNFPVQGGVSVSSHRKQRSPIGAGSLLITGFIAHPRAAVA